MSPEVLSDQEAGVGVDLWALGCVVYQMLVGRPPFQGMSQYLIFEQIRQCTISFPNGTDSEGQDFVRKLLVADPQTRLGAGEVGSDNDLAALKSHPFISRFDIENILNIPVPYNDWPKKDEKKSSDAEDEEENEDIEIGLLNSKKEEIKITEPKILLSGVIKKKCGWFFKKRYLVVSNEPRIYYTDTSSSTNIREIMLSKDLKAEHKAGNDFIINNPQRSYYFRELISNPQRWVEAINKVIKDHFL